MIEWRANPKKAVSYALQLELAQAALARQPESPLLLSRVGVLQERLRQPRKARAALEAMAQQTHDLAAAFAADGAGWTTLRIDGGMSANPTFTQALANATQRTVEISPVLEATTLGAAFLAGLSVGTWRGGDDIAATWRPSHIVEPNGDAHRDRWRAALERSRGWHADLSSFDF